MDKRFFDSYGNPWDACSPETDGAVAFGPCGTAKPAPDGSPRWSEETSWTDELAWAWACAQDSNDPDPPCPGCGRDFTGGVIAETGEAICTQCAALIGRAPSCPLFGCGCFAQGGVCGAALSGRPPDGSSGCAYGH